MIKEIKIRGHHILADQTIHFGTINCFSGLSGSSVLDIVEADALHSGLKTVSLNDAAKELIDTYKDRVTESLDPLLCLLDGDKGLINQKLNRFNSAVNEVLWFFSSYSTLSNGQYDIVIADNIGYFMGIKSSKLLIKCMYDWVINSETPKQLFITNNSDNNLIEDVAGDAAAKPDIRIFSIQKHRRDGLMLHCVN
jgi:hypothetical protein